MSKSSKLSSQDAFLAWQIHNQINRLDVTGITENATFPNSNSKENYKPKTLIDNTLEIIDPTPNIHTLFVQFDKRFFSNKLLSVEVKWSHRMTSCAGTCTFNTGSRYCVIALSSPLLKLRPRKDLIETLLHEMIHAFLFVTNNNRDRDGHGPEFCKHMHRINKEAGTNITIYHTFHAEVKLYQQHWWRCNGPCQKKHPFFGMVRRAMNRAPGPSDFWWKEHQLTCGGQFIKVREPEKPQKKGKKAKDDPKKPSIDKWLIPSPDNKPKGKSNDFQKPKDKIGKKNGGNNFFKSGGVGLKTKGGSSVLTVNKWNAKANSNEPGITKLGNTTNNVHGFGTGGPGSSNSASTSKKTTSSGNSGKSSSSVLGGSGSGQSRLLQIFGSSKTNSQLTSSENNKKESKNSNCQDLGPTVKCPICNDLILEKIANQHIDTCLMHKKEKTPFNNSTPKFTPKFPSIENNKKNEQKDTVNCPICNKQISISLMTGHIDKCLEDDKNSPSISNEISTIEIDDSDCEIVTPAKKRKISDFFNSKETKLSKTDDKKANCPICKKEMKIDEMNSHLDDCLISELNEAGPSSKVDKNDVVVIDDSLEKKIENGTKPEKCLICDKILDPEIPLTQHLDDCLKDMFNDDETSFIEEIKKSQESQSASSTKEDDFVEIDDASSEELNGLGDNDLGDEDLGDKEKGDRFPCPVCLTLVPQTEMNKHLDSCLG